jgi:hypothetical protein
MPLLLPPSFAGKTVACSRCGHAVLVTAASPEPQAADPRPPHLQTAAAVPQSAAAKAVAIELNRKHRSTKASRKRSCVGLMLVAAALSMAAVVGLGLLVVHLVQMGQTPAVAEGNGGETGANRAFNKREYTDASRKAITIAGVTVRIEQAQVGKVDYRSQGKILQTATPHYLIVNVNVKNKSRGEPVRYQSWCDHTFEDGQGQSEDVELQDDNGRRWEVFVLPEADMIERHVKPESSLSADDEITDSLVFQLPEEYHDGAVPPLFLALPAAAVGSAGDYFRFKLPGLMIARREQ